MFPEIGQTGGEIAVEGPDLKDDLTQQDSHNDGGNDNSKEQQDSHKRVRLRNRELFGIGLNAVDDVFDTAIASVRDVSGPID